MDDSEGTGRTPVLTPPAEASAAQPGRPVAEREFVAELAQVRVGRAWLREVLPAGCSLRDDCVAILSELLANCAEHGGGGRVGVTIAHGRGRVSGELVHHMPPRGEPGTRPEVAAQTARLLRGEDPAAAGELAEDGRGLLVVRLLADSCSYLPDVDRSVFRWELAGCEERGEDRRCSG